MALAVPLPIVPKQTRKHQPVPEYNQPDFEAGFHEHVDNPLPKLQIYKKKKNKQDPGEHLSKLLFETNIPHVKKTETGDDVIRLGPNPNIQPGPSKKRKT